MNSFITFVLFIFIASVLARKHSVKLTFHVKEKQAHFKQDVEADVYNNHAYFKTPAHNDVTETHKIQDFNKGIQLSCMPLIGECHVFTIDRTTYPHPGKLIIDAQSTTNDLTDETAVLQTFHWIKTSRVDSTDSFSKEMVAFYQNYKYPLFTLERIHNTSLIIRGSLSKRDTVQLVNTVYPNLVPPRVIVQHCHGQAPQERYGYTGTSGCDYLTFCDGISKRAVEVDPFGRHSNSTVGLGQICHTRHVVNSIFYKCLCCPGDHRVRDCIFCQNLSKHSFPVNR